MESVKLDIQPDSDEHFEIRKDYWCASEASAVMNISPFKPRNREELALYKKGQLDLEIFHKAVEHGKKYEGHARLSADLKCGTNFTPEIWVKDRFLASPDGISTNQEIYLEIKCPFSPTSPIIKSVEKGEIPENYKWQLDHGMYVTGCKKALFAVLYPDGHTMKYIDYLEDHERQGRLVDAWNEFDKFMKKPVFEIKKLSENNLEGKELQQVQSLIHAKQILDQARSDYDEIAKNSIKILRGIRFKHPQVSLVAEQKKKGTIQWNTAFKDIEKFLPKDFDIENYRSKEQTTKPYFKFK